MARKISMEDILNDDQTEGEESDVVEDEVEEVEDGDIEPSYEIEEVEDAMDDAEDAVAAMEALVEKVEGYLANGGMSPETADMVNFSMECIGGRYGVKMPTMPAMEDFDEAGGRVTATGFALEGLKENLKKWWEGIQNWVKKWIGKFQAFVQTHLSEAGRLKKAAVNLKAKYAKRAKGDKTFTPKEAEIKISAKMEENLSFGSVSASSTAAGLKEIAKVVTDLSSDVSTMTAINGTLAHPAGLTAVAAAFKGQSKLPKLSEKSATDNVVVLDSEAMIGNVKGEVTLYGDTAGNFNRLSVSLVSADKAKKFTAGTIKPLSDAEAGTILDAVIATCDALTNAKLDKTKADAVKALVAAGDKSIKRLSEGADSDEKKQLKGFVSATVTNAKALMEPLASVRRQARNSAHAAYGLAVSSFNNSKVVSK